MWNDSKQEGMRGEIGTILIVDEDARSAGELQASLERRGFSAVVARSKEEALEALGISEHRPGRFSQEGKQIPAVLGHQVGIEIEKTGLFEETAGALARSNLLYELSNQLHSIQDFEDTVQLAAQQILEAFQADGTLISLHETPPGAVTRVGVFLGGRRGSERSSDLDPISQAVMEAGKPILVSSASHVAAHVSASLLEEGVEALMAVPVQGMSGRHGALALYYRRPREFRPLEVETLGIYANHLGIGLENARLYAASQQRAERIAAISRLSRVISSSLDISEVYQTFAEEVKQLIQYDRMGVVVPDASGKGFTILKLAGDQPTIGEQRAMGSNGEGTGVQWVMSRRQPHVERDLAEKRLFTEDELLLSEGVRSCVRLPLIARGKVLGALFLENATPCSYGERELELLVPLGEQLAIAIENARLFQEINRLAVTDELTGLFNPRHFYHHLEQEFRRAQRYSRPLSLIMLDIDHFKRYNDLHGHLAGDQVLRVIAGRLRSNTRGVDFLARYGGDEFSIILPETDLGQARVQAERIRSAIEQDSPGIHDPTGGKGLTASLGLACVGPDIRHIEDLVGAADRALYRSKAAGGNQISLA